MPLLQELFTASSTFSWSAVAQPGDEKFPWEFAGSFSFQCNLLQYHTMEKGIICHFCYSVLLVSFQEKFPDKISELHVLKYEGGMNEWRIVSRHFISICINLTKANVRKRKESPFAYSN